MPQNVLLLSAQTQKTHHNSHDANFHHHIHIHRETKNKNKKEIKIF